MTADQGIDDRRRSLRDDLLDDLRQAPPRVPNPVAAEPRPAAAVPAPQTPMVELRITPRSWAPAEFSALPRGGGFVLSVGPVRLSLGRGQS